jgi:hypothetical protein
MSTALPISTPKRTVSRRTQALAAVSALVAAASVAVTLAVTGGGSDTSSRAPSASPAVAQPDRATLYRHEAGIPAPSVPVHVPPAPRFHHR